MKKTIIYIDGFNLYYRLKYTPYRWLNLQKLSETFLNPKQHDIRKIKYFTALVKRTSDNNSSIIKQNIYLRALRTISNLEIIFGQFKKRQVTGIRYHYKEERDKFATITKWEEKESDVNIATHLMEDGYENQYECAVLISNDTDLRTPLLRIKRKLKKTVGIISPYKRTHIELQKSSHFHKTISIEILKKCQFSEKIEDAKGEFFCPPTWKEI